MVLIIAKNLDPNLRCNTYRAVKNSYPFFEGQPTQVEDPEDVKFFLNRRGRFEVYSPEDKTIISNVEEYEEYKKKKLDKKAEKEAEKAEEDSEEKSDEAPEEDKPEESTNDVAAAPSLEFVKDQKNKLKAKDFLKWIRQFGVKAKSEKAALKQFEKLHGGN